MASHDAPPPPSPRQDYGDYGNEPIRLIDAILGLLIVAAAWVLFSILWAGCARTVPVTPPDPPPLEQTERACLARGGQWVTRHDRIFGDYTICKEAGSP